MAESTLTLQKADLEQKVGIFLGYGAGTAGGQLAWTVAQARNIKDCLDSGYRNFLFPAPQAPGLPYVWTFLRPVAELALPTDANTLAMPDDFGGIVGAITVTQGGNGVWQSQIVPTGEGQVRLGFARTPDQSGPPLLAAIVPLKGVALNRSNRYELQVFPTAEQDYTLRFCYEVLADAISSATPFAYGGAAHSETIRQAILAHAEMEYNNLPNGPHQNAFQQRLAASIAADRNLRPATLGYNGDNSDRFRGRYFDPRYSTRATFDGVQY